jgi:hypothetical protein
MLVLRRGKCTLGAERRIGRQLGGALVERRARREAAPGPRARGRVLELGGDVLVEPVRRVGAVPRAAIRIDLCIRGVGECAVDALALLRCGRAINRRPHERMPEADLRPELHARRRRRPCRGRLDAQLGRRVPHEQRITNRLGRRDQEQDPRRLRERREPLPEALLDATGERGAAVQAEPAGEFVRRPAARELEQCERIAARLGDDPIAHALVERTCDDAFQQRLRIMVFQAMDDELRQPVETPLARRLTDGEDEADRLGLQTAGHKRQRLRRRRVEPPRVVDDADQWPLLGHVGQEAQEGEADEKPIRGVAISEAEHCAESIALWARQTFQAIHERRAKLVHSRERELHLGLDSRRPPDAAP